MHLENGEDLGFGKVETESAHCDFEFVVVDFGIFVKVEEIEL